MRIFSRFSTLLLLTLILVGCFGSTDTPVSEVDVSGLKKETGTGYKMSVPASWEKVDPSKIVAPVSGKIELAMRSLISTRGFKNNLVILSDTLLADATASEYVSQSMNWASREYLSMTIVSDEQITFSDDATSRLVIFRAKYNEVTEEHLFMQTAHICDKKVYLITLGLENSTADADFARYHPILESFSCL